MRIPKFMVLSCAVVLGTVGSLQAQRDDSDLQAKARDELHKKMMELNSTPSAVPAPAPVAPVKKPKPVKVQAPPVVNTPPPVVATPPPVVKAPPPPVVKPIPAVVPPPPAPVAASASSAGMFMPPPNPDRVKAEEVLRQKMAELNAQDAGAKPAMVMSHSSDADARDVAKTEAELKARSDAKARAKAPKAVLPPPVETTPGVPPPVVISPTVASSTTPPPVIVPAAMGSKEQRLGVLLQQYKADQITPQEYHAQRAKILAEP